MSSTPANINIDISDKCDLKCKLTLEYPTEGIDISRKSENSFDSVECTNLQFTGQANIKYNYQLYQLDQINIFKPSLHLYAGRRIEAELVLVHGNVLLCIPVISKPYSGVLDEILNKLDSNTTANIKLDTIVPKKPFYAYSGSISNSSQGPYDIIVFRKMDALSINEEWFKTLKIHDGSEKFELDNNEKISYNKNGPINGNIDQVFPITCEPIIDSEDIEQPKPPSRSPLGLSEKEMANLANKAIVQIVVGMLIIILLYYVFSFIFKKTNKVANSVSDPVKNMEFK